MPEEPLLSEVVRRLEDLSGDVRDLRRVMDTNYVRQDVYRSDQQLASQERRETAAQVLSIADAAKRKAEDVERRVEKAESARKTANLAMVVAFATPVITAVVARALN